MCNKFNTLREAGRETPWVDHRRCSSDPRRSASLTVRPVGSVSRFQKWRVWQKYYRPSKRLGSLRASRRRPKACPIRAYGAPAQRPLSIFDVTCERLRDDVSDADLNGPPRSCCGGCTIELLGHFLNRGGERIELRSKPLTAARVLRQLSAADNAETEAAPDRRRVSSKKCRHSTTIAGLTNYYRKCK